MGMKVMLTEVKRAIPCDWVAREKQKEENKMKKIAALIMLAVVLAVTGCTKQEAPAGGHDHSEHQH